jgi:ubiquinone/menaquinone biosynthesis C-methylase UbiE
LYHLVDALDLPKGSQVLDWGCGSGHVSVALQRKGMQVTAFSLADSPVRKEAKITFVRGTEVDPTKLPFKANQFDLVVSCAVLEHVRETGGDELASLQELRRVVKPDGYLVCFHLPNKYSWIDWLVGKLRPSLGTHQYRYGWADIDGWCDQADLKLMKIGRYALLPKMVFNYLPGWLANNAVVVRAYYRLDAVLERLLPIISHNYYFIARKVK